MTFSASTPLRQRPAYQALEQHYAAIKDQQLKDLFAGDPTRGTALTLEAEGIYLDYSKQRVTAETIGLLVELAEQSGLADLRAAMFGGEHINITEDRAVLHVALRAPAGEVIETDGADVVPDVHEVLGRMRAFADRIRSREWKGHTGKPIRNIVNIGIGGSDLGPVMAYEALKSYSDRNLTFRFVSNVDGTDFAEKTHSRRWATRPPWQSISSRSPPTPTR
jgi:glucose-6-phosphate isomerase